ncbi:type II toxin-antitoxin system TacA family antitoxin [Corynebacterium riegelii]|uniref:type II toxin-antitoxin system TacA family antitoxin n=1 Tax=Corynebacterium riegelii TaxID=156976 RepID=UPI000C766A86|nr:DUF1778 domain-containing protein [Corynebacterium riegelii]MDK7181371.1 DUF1778 domain-containing protein [Corynebacterium riegelii]PLA12611.1 antitoxin [Corynebacterium riegelii]
MTLTKDKRLNLRTTAQQDQRLKQAAEVREVSVSEFILKSAMTEAEKVLADRRWFELNAEDFAKFEQALDTPVDGTKLARLLASESVFGKEFTLD